MCNLSGTPKPFLCLDINTAIWCLFIHKKKKSVILLDAWSGDLQLKPTRGRNHAGHLVVTDAFAKAVIYTVFGINRARIRLDVRNITTEVTFEGILKAYIIYY